MKTQPISVGEADEVILVHLPRHVLEMVGWADGKELTVDIPVTGGGILLYVDGPLNPHFKGVREIVK